MKRYQDFLYVTRRRYQESCLDVKPFQLPTALSQLLFRALIPWLRIFPVLPLTSTCYITGKTRAKLFMLYVNDYYYRLNVDPWIYAVWHGFTSKETWVFSGFFRKLVYQENMLWLHCSYIGKKLGSFRYLYTYICIFLKSWFLKWNSFKETRFSKDPETFPQKT